MHVCANSPLESSAAHVRGNDATTAPRLTPTRACFFLTSVAMVGNLPSCHTLAINRTRRDVFFQQILIKSLFSDILIRRVDIRTSHFLQVLPRSFVARGGPFLPIESMCHASGDPSKSCILRFQAYRWYEIHLNHAQ